jgi:membrane fusion protein (multidrug efflux system)
MRVNRKPLLQFSALSSSLALSVALLAGCGGGKDGAAAGAGGMPQMPPPEVAVVVIQKGSLPIDADLPGRVEAARTAEVRARVPGIVLRREFVEGAEVKAGQVLFRIDPASYQAALDNAKAQLAKNEAIAANAKAVESRANSLIASKMISQQDYDAAIASARGAQADVLAAKADLEAARLNLGYATVTAPISGRIGRALVTEGALVGQGEATPLAVIQQLDSVYVNFAQSTAVVLKLRQANAAGRLKGLANAQTPVSVVLEDGSVYPHAGHLLFSDLAVDPSTGAVTLRGEVPNPDHLLLPGLFVKVRMALGVAQDAITVPQRAVMRTPQGATVYVVGADGNVLAQPIKTDIAQGDSWLVSEGLKGGEQVIVDGLQKVKPGAPAKAVPADQSTGATAPAAAAATAAAGK